ncbi:MAG TPA: acyl-CoA dehydrogenase family protein, partial [Mycobacteriales bacterium]|nr:acyl-CoA dehydrogenase family protein [Mycobacteriales bacterium]
MFFDYSAEQTALRHELRPYLEALAAETTDDLNAPGDGDPKSREAFRRLGKDGWLGVGWPKEYG